MWQGLDGDGSNCCSHTKRVGLALGSRYYQYAETSGWVTVGLRLRPKLVRKSWIVDRAMNTNRVEVVATRLVYA